MTLFDLTQPKPRYERTELVVGGEARCLVVAPLRGEYFRIGRRVATGLREWTGVEPPLLTPAEMKEEDLERFHLVLVGNAIENEWILRLYAQHYCFTDALYPGPGGMEIRTIHNPWGTGRNVLLLGGSTEEDVNRAVVSFNRSLRLFPSEQVVLARINFARSSLHCPIEPTEEVRRKAIQQACAAFQPHGPYEQVWEALHRACEFGFYYYQTDHEGWAEVFRAIVLRYIEVAQEEGDWWLARFGYGEPYSWQWKFTVVWDLIEESPCFSEEDRLAIDRMLLRNAERLAALSDFSPRLAWERGPRSNRAVLATTSLLRVLRFLRKGYGGTALAVQGQEIPFQDLFPLLNHILEEQSLSPRPISEAAPLFWVVPELLCTYLAEEGWESTLEQGGHFQHWVRRAIVTTDNRGEEATFGQVARYQPGSPTSSPRMNVLLKAACYHQNPTWMAFREWLRRGQPEFAYDLEEPQHWWSWYTGAYYPDLKPASDFSELAQVQVLEMDEAFHRHLQERSPETLPKREETFDKLCMRRDFDPQSEYLLLDGVSGGFQGHEDGNAILRLTWQDRIWLADLHLLRHLPKYHNSLHILHEGRYRPPPPLTRLRTRVDLPSLGYTRTQVQGYNDTNWTRHILWEKGKRFLIFDVVEFLKPGHYQVDAYWRFLGEVEEGEQGWRVRQGERTLGVWNADSSRKERDEEPFSFLHDWRAYPYAQDPVKIWRQRYRLEAQEGERVVFVNLLQPAEEALEVERVGETVVRLSAEGLPLGYWGVGVGETQIGNFRMNARCFILQPGRWQLGRVQHLILGQPLLEADLPLDAEFDLFAGTALLRTENTVMVRLWAQGALVDGRPAPPDPEYPGYLRIVLEPGEHHLSGLPAEAYGREGWVTVAQSLDLLQTPRWEEPLVSRFQVLPKPPLPSPFSGEKVAQGQGAVRAISVAAGDDGPQVAVAWEEGEYLWLAPAFRLQSRLEASLRAALLADLDGDGCHELFLGDGERGVHCLDAEGRLRWRFDCGHARGRPGVVSALASARWEPGRPPALLVGAENWSLFALTAEGHMLWRYEVPGYGVTRLHVADFDADGREEVLVGTEARSVSLVGPQGEPRWIATGGLESTALASGDLNGDGFLEALMGAADGLLSLVEARRGFPLERLPMGEDVVFLHVGSGALLTAASLAGLWLWKQGMEGEPQHRLLPGSPTAGLALPDGTFLLGIREGELWHLSLEGELLHRHPLDGPVTHLALAADGSLWVGTRTGSLWQVRLEGL